MEHRGNADLRETKQIIYHSKSIDESYPKLYFLLNLSHYVKSFGYFFNFWHFLTMPAHQVWLGHMIQEGNFEKFLFCSNSALNWEKSQNF